MDQKFELINKHCGKVEDRIRVCHDRHVAEMLKDVMCKELLPECSSLAVKNILIKQINKVINETFDRNGKNIFLKEQNR